MTAKVGNIVEEIAVVSQEQATGIADVNTAVTQIEQMTAQNATLLEEAAAASQSLGEHAGELNESLVFSRRGKHLLRHCGQRRSVVRARARVRWRNCKVSAAPAWQVQVATASG